MPGLSAKESTRKLRTERALVAENSEVMGNFILLLNQRNLIVLKFRGKKPVEVEKLKIQET